MITLFMQQASNDVRHGSNTVKPVCLHACSVVPDSA